MRDEERALDVRRQHAVDELLGHVPPRLLLGRDVADVVHEHVDAPELVAGSRHQRFGDVGLAHIGNDARSTAACARDRDLGLTGARFVDLRDHDRRAFGRKPFRDAAADPASAAGDDRDLAREQFAHGLGR